jgi:hypothetical protein
MNAATSAVSTKLVRWLFGHHAGDDVAVTDQAQAHVVADLVVGEQRVHPAGADMSAASDHGT